MSIRIPNLQFNNIDQFENYDVIVFEHTLFILVTAKISAILETASESSWDSFEQHEINRCRIDKRRFEKITGKWCAKQAFRYLNQETVHIHADSHAPKLYKNDKQLEDWYVSISHSHGYVGAALSRSRIGLDLEKQRYFKDSLRNFFCNEVELVYLSTLTDQEKQKCSLQLFCGKEAILKTLGLGIAGGPEKAIIEDLRDNIWVDAQYQNNQYKVYFTRPNEMGLCVCLDIDNHGLL
ncbi:MAG: 4'-phosphopantetheinyl transferase superfamily protein [bacterium]|nr:4'-phosphopantetheinyl transferase superfamily protein [bacterium]